VTAKESTLFDYVFVAEKPSLAKEVAEARAEQLGVRASRGAGYWAVGNDAVTWLFGHMYETAPPEFYDGRYKSWLIDDLPIIPSKWALVLNKDKEDHVAAIRGLLKKTRNVVNVGDAGREGQLLVDELLIENGWDAFSESTHRLWVRSVARKDLLDALRDMFPNARKRDLYNSAVCRQRADWLLGMNLTRLYTKLAERAGARLVVSVGRVMTPTLKLVVDRDREIENFKAVDHYTPSVLFRHANGAFKATWIAPSGFDEGMDPEGRLVDRSVAERIANKVAGRTGAVESFEAKPKSKAPPLPYSLSALQKECSAKFGLTAQQTLDVAQQLYDEHKVTTYPRSDSRHLPSALRAEAPTIVGNLKGTQALGEVAEGANLALKSAAWDDSKVSDHHGIVPTVEATQARLGGLSDIQRKVFMLIAKAFLAQFYPDMRYKSLNAVVGVEGERFKATGRLTVDLGWTRVYGAEEKDEEQEEEDQAVPQMERGDAVKAEAAEILDRRTTPPARFNDGTLVEAMTQIHKYVQNAEIKKRLKETSGIGTEATRAATLEKLVKLKFLERKGKHLVSSTVGRSVTDVVSPEVSDPGLTAVWEGYLERIAAGELDPNQFMSGQINSLTKRIEAALQTKVEIKGASIATLPGHGTACPACGQGTLITRQINKGEHKGKKFLSCDRYPDCKHVVWEQKEVKPIEGHGAACPACAKGQLLTKEIQKGEHKGKKFLSCSNYPECRHAQWPKPQVKPIDGHGRDCPACAKGKLETREIQKGEHKGKRFLSCTNYPECRHAEWPKPEVAPIEGHGAACPACAKGQLLTKEVQKGEHKGKRFLSCSNYPECRHAVWPKAKVEPLPGDGGRCPQCSKGQLLTKELQKGEHKGKRFLSCTNYPECKHAEWPKDGKGGAKGGGKDGGGRGKEGAGRRGRA